jgi:hypothetical protein
VIFSNEPAIHAPQSSNLPRRPRSRITREWVSRVLLLARHSRVRLVPKYP